MPHGFCAALFGSDVPLVLRDDVVVDDSHPRLRERALISFHPTNPGTDLWSTNVSNSFAANVDQVLRGQHSHRFIIYADEICRKTRQASINQYIGCVLFFDTKENIYGRAA